MLETSILTQGHISTSFIYLFIYFLFFIFIFCFFLGGGSTVAYRSSQARGPVGSAAAPEPQQCCGI